MDERLRYFEGVPCVGERLLTSEEKASVAQWHENSRRKVILSSLGCVGATIGVAGCFAAGFYLFNIFAGIFGTIGFLAVGGYLIYALRSGIELEKLGRTELRNNRVERFGDSDTIVEVLPSSGRILSINDVSTNGAEFGVIRDVGTPPIALGDTRGNRRLSEHEKEEIRQLSELTRRRWTLADAIAVTWFVVLLFVTVGLISVNGIDETIWIVLFLVIPASVPSDLVVWRRIDHRRLRRRLQRALAQDAFIETTDEEGRRYGFLEPDGLLWTLDDAPSPLRTRWRP